MSDNLPSWLRDAPQIKKKGRSPWRLYLAIVVSWGFTLLGFSLISLAQDGGGVTLGPSEALLMFTPLFGGLLVFAWGYHDARARGKSGLLGGIVVLLFFPLGLLIWLALRPGKSL